LVCTKLEVELTIYETNQQSRCSRSCHRNYI